MKSKFVLVLIFQPLLAAGQAMQSLTQEYPALGAYSINHIDAFSFGNNQASMSRLKNMTAGIFAERKYLLDELTSFQASMGLPTRSGNFGLHLGYFGFNQSNETKAGLAYARKLGSKADVGVQFNYNSIRTGGYGNSTAITVEAGTILHISEKLHAGFHVNNPIGGRFGKDHKEKLPSVYKMGLGYDASEIFFFSAEMIKEENQPLNVHAGFQYKFMKLLMARAGISTATSSAWLGLGLLLKSFRADVITSYHPQLGLSPGLLLIFNFKKRES